MNMIIEKEVGTKRIYVNIIKIVVISNIFNMFLITFLGQNVSDYYKLLCFYKKTIEKA